MTLVRPHPDPATFRDLARPGHVIPVWLELPFDTRTAVTAYAALRRPPFGFLLESVIGGERWARWTFLGSEPAEAWRLDDDRISRWRPEEGWTAEGATEDPFADFAAWIGRWQPVEVPGLPRFWGGAVGFFGYDTVRWLERLPDAPPRDVACPDACFLLTDRVLIVDNLFDRALALKAVRDRRRWAAARAPLRGGGRGAGGLGGAARTRRLPLPGLSAGHREEVELALQPL